jgi:DNA-binding MarR family transcriptional regulator
MAATPNLSEEQLQTWRAFLRAHSMMLRRIARDLEDAELPPLAWYDVLAALRDAPEGQRLKQVELAERVLLSNSGLSRLIDRIEAKGLVERVQCPGDRRSLHIQLTDAGRRMLNDMWPVYARGIAEDFMPSLGSNLEEVRQVLENVASTCDAVHEAEESERAGDEAPAAGSGAA